MRRRWSNKLTHPRFTEHPVYTTHSADTRTCILFAQSLARRHGGSTTDSHSTDEHTEAHLCSERHRGGAGFKTKFSDSQMVLWPVHCFRILTFCLWSVAGCLFLKWLQHYFHPVFQDPCPNCPGKRWNLFLLPRNLARLWWLPGQTEMQINQPTWLPWLGNKR